MPYDQYTVPLPNAQFSQEYFVQLTVGATDDLVKNEDLPFVLPKGSLLQWMFHQSIPTKQTDINLDFREFIPCLDDLLEITSAMEYAYHNGARSVFLVFPVIRTLFSTIFQR
jgi:hypothetical protein